MDAPFTMEEMKRAIMRSGLTSTGKDEICYVMLKHLGVLASMKLLGFYNKVWAVGKLPTGWKDAMIIPIRKPGKDPSNPKNYRPKALTSHIGKIMERMITDYQFTWKVEEFYHPIRVDLGGVEEPWTLLYLDTEIRKAHVNK